MNDSRRSVAIIVGASRGIGAATAVALGRLGTVVCVAAPPGESCEPVLAAVRAEGGTAEAYECDAGRWDQVEGLVSAVLERHGKVDSIVNCAGIMQPVALVESCDAEAWARCQTVNLVGAFHGCRAVLPHFRSRGQGVIVNMSTGAAFHALEGWSAYCCSKAGLLMLSRIVAAEVKDTDIRVYSFQPGMVNTALGRESMRVNINRVTTLDPGTFAPPEEPARAIAWLCTERPADLAGQEVVVTDPGVRRRAGLATG
jgi:3-oxoacyl-[acyl-carrier protein] reductase